ncbi:MAG: metallopeptidase family protein [Candidatus Kerfeldbacteria bacterium]|jgi:predicted Zn-dependent protease with MMP-like domain
MDLLEFEDTIKQAVEAVPTEIRKNMVNIGFVVEDDPRAAKNTEHAIKSNGVLLGLYQGVPLPKRSAYYSGALPDKITIFKNSIERIFGPDTESIKRKIFDVVHHEIGHYLGMDEHTVRKWEKNRNNK